MVDLNCLPDMPGREAYTAFPPLALRPLTPLMPLTSRGLRGAIKHCTQIANPPPSFLTRSTKLPHEVMLVFLPGVAPRRL